MLTVARAARDIESMRVRGAGKIARHAVAALRDVAATHEGSEGRLARELQRSARRLVATRPTAVSLRNAVEEATAPLARHNGSLRADVLAASERFLDRSLRAVEVISTAGAKLLDGDGVVLTHCNSACSVGVIATAARRHRLEAIATETRPRRQGHLTATQLRARGVPVTLIVDGAVNLAMREVDWVVVGADTIARNGDVVNKVGTSLVALSAREHGVPFYVAAETYKVDRRARTGEQVAIEERAAREVLEGRRLPGVRVANPVFDVTPARLVTRIVTEVGTVPPSGLAPLLARSSRRRRAGSA
ncbi:MAG TPA: S-methyl-5-thioribose-1-phosphate isomerase [Candidatus Thermoplasmatota archaeon]|jgi:ribose 1,5-bisphosphate isomerase|nr:S-methyl-5-thioribose-1-phosphate isomerase [Candidatus Thermoplasmatota archaeon]